MPSTVLRLAQTGLLPLLSCLVAGFARAESTITTLDDITVRAARPFTRPFAASPVRPEPFSLDLAEALDRQPGAAVVRNGPLTGIAQVRGLAGDRVNILVDGMRITPACPNHMDPPLHYAAPREIDALTLVAGTSPVSAGGDALGASLVAAPRRPDFAEGPEWRPAGALDAGFSGANDGWNLGLDLGAAREDRALAYTGSVARGDDLRFPGGRVRDTGYDTRRHKLAYAHALEPGRLDLSVSQHRTRDAGTPALPMDMVKDDADAVNLAWEGRLGTTRVTARVYRHDIQHLMDNYSLRPNAGTRMYAPADSTDTGLALAGRRTLGGGEARFGLEWLMNDFDAYQWNASTGVFGQDILRDASRDRLGLYGEWDGALTGGWRALLGLRSDTVRMDTGPVRAGAAQAVATAGLGGAFNALDRRRTDHNWDWSALFQYAAAQGPGYEIGLSRKTRSPSLLERYEWTPLNASAGQADNNSYYGDPDLRPEVAHALNLAAKGRVAAHDLRLGAFYQRVEDYIVGSPVPNPAGPAPANVLRFQNHDARLHGLDGTWQWRGEAWGFSGVLSWVRGRDLDRNAELYRIAPLRLTLEAEHRGGAWTHALRLRTARGQDKVALYNLPGLTNEQPTDGYAVLDWRGEWRAGKGVKLGFGIENLFDRLYFDHLEGINRVSGGDVAVGTRLPGAGRFAYVSLSARF